MTEQRRKTAQVAPQFRLAVLLGALVLCGCGYGSPFGQFREMESPAVADAPYPTLLEARQAAAALGPSPDPAIGARVVSELDVEAAVSTAQAERLRPPVFDAPALQADARAVRAAAR